MYMYVCMYDVVVHWVTCMLDTASVTVWREVLPERVALLKNDFP